MSWERKKGRSVLESAKVRILAVRWVCCEQMSHW
jgi:hypothetical protein